jgi:hypothetical protein
MSLRFNPYKEISPQCWFLLTMSFTPFVILALLNLYIGYEVIKYLFGDGWSFLGGLLFSMSFIVTIPVLILSAVSIRMIRNDDRKKYIFPVSLGIIGILSGVILNKATELWIYIIAFSVILLISCFVCAKDKKKNVTIN